MMTLPAELRVAVYQFAFTPKFDGAKEINIRAQRGPTCDLLLTCTEILHDAKPTYDAAMKTFSTTPYKYFTIIYKSLHVPRFGEVKRAYMPFFRGQPYLPGATSLRIIFNRRDNVLSKFAVRFEVDEEGYACADVVDPEEFHYCNDNDVQKVELMVNNIWNDDMVTSGGFLDVEKCFVGLGIFVHEQFTWADDGIWFDEDEFDDEDELDDEPDDESDVENKLEEQDGDESD